MGFPTLTDESSLPTAKSSFANYQKISRQLAIMHYTPRYIRQRDWYSHIPSTGNIPLSPSAVLQSDTSRP